MFLLIGAFIAGILTVLAPCALPMLPIIIGGSVSGDQKDKKRPFLIAASLAVSLIFFTLLLKISTILINFPPQYITYASGVIIIGLGLATLFPGRYAKLIADLGIEKAAQKALGKGYKNKDSVAGPIMIGAALGPVFSSCSPVYAYILATVLPASFGQAISYIVAYVLGLALVMLLIGYYGQQFIGRVKFATDPKGTFQRVLAIIFIIVGVLIASGYDKRLQVYVAQHTGYDFSALSIKLLPSSKHKVDNSQLFNVDHIPAPEFVGLQDWINSEPRTIASLKGHVVLLDFWTYSCINCIRNNPHINQLYQKYKDQGFVAIGLHAPEFAFEKVPANVRKAVIDQHISYPVALDNDLATWSAYSNRSWPASYLIDAEGNVRRIHEGEGKYVEEEQAVRALLEEKGAKIAAAKFDQESVVPVTAAQTPETYLGSDRAANFSGIPGLGSKKIADYTPAETLSSNQWTLGGKWEVQGQKIIARGNSRLKFKLSAREVYLVGGSPTPQAVGVTLNSQPISDAGSAGDDVNASSVMFGESRLYRLVKYSQLTKDGTLELTVPDGVEFNAFTFAS